MYIVHNEYFRKYVPTQKTINLKKEQRVVLGRQFGKCTLTVNIKSVGNINHNYQNKTTYI